MNSEKIINPILKWAGGKRQLIPELKKYIPAKFNKYIEPFFGGGALFIENFICSSSVYVDSESILSKGQL